MKGVILAGGTGSRLNPITAVVNKNVLPVYNKPAIFYSIELLKNAGINEICIVSEYRYNEDFRTLIGNGFDFNVHITYENDSPLKKGPASALYHAKKFCGKDNLTLIFADGIYDIDISEQVKKFKGGAQSFLKRVDNPKQYGVYEIDSKGKVLSIEEKPEHPKSNLVFTGLVMYDHNVFRYIEEMTPGLNGEYYTVDLDKRYLAEKKLVSTEIMGFWRDIGTFDGLYKASEYWYNKVNNINNIKA